MLLYIFLPLRCYLLLSSLRFIFVSLSPISVNWIVTTRYSSSCCPLLLLSLFHLSHRCSLIPGSCFPYLRTFCYNPIRNAIRSHIHNLSASYLSTVHPFSNLLSPAYSSSIYLSLFHLSANCSIPFTLQPFTLMQPQTSKYSSLLRYMLCYLLTSRYICIYSLAIRYHPSTSIQYA
jgi:hypothetical protein